MRSGTELSQFRRLFFFCFGLFYERIYPLRLCLQLTVFVDEKLNPKLLSNLPRDFVN